VSCHYCSLCFMSTISLTSFSTVLPGQLWQRLILLLLGKGANCIQRTPNVWLTLSTYQLRNISNIWSFYPEIYHWKPYAFFLFQRRVTLSDIRTKSRKRTFCGYSVPILIKCHGTECHLYGDRVKATLQSGKRTLEIYFPVSVSFRRSPIFVEFIK